MVGLYEHEAEALGSMTELNLDQTESNQQLTEHLYYIMEWLVGLLVG
jgi:hypothetical protein